MSASITDAHRKIATELCRNATGSNRALHHVPKFAQLIADSEARAKESLLVAYDVVCEVRNRLTTERDRLRAEVINLAQSRDNWESACKANDACVVQFKARAEKAEAQRDELAIGLTQAIAQRDQAEHDCRVLIGQLNDAEAAITWVFANGCVRAQDFTSGDRDIYEIHTPEELKKAMKETA
jgi:hypothetical protein